MRPWYSTVATHIHVRTHAYMYIRAYTCTHTCTRTHTHARPHSHPVPPEARGGDEPGAAGSLRGARGGGQR